MVQIYKAPLSNIKYAYVETRKQYKSVLAELGIPFDMIPEPPCAAHTQTMTNKRTVGKQTITSTVCIVWMLPTGDVMKDVVLLVHEATHIKQEIEDWMSEDKFSPEVEAYIMQELVENLLLAYNAFHGG